MCIENNSILFKFYYGLLILIGFALTIFNKDGRLLGGLALFFTFKIVIEYFKTTGPKTCLSYIKSRIGLTLCIIIMFGFSFAALWFHIYSTP
jgi:hypothetical protein